MRQPVREIRIVGQRTVRKQLRCLQNSLRQQVFNICSTFHLSLQKRCKAGQIRVVEK